MTLSSFITTQREQILEAWESDAAARFSQAESGSVVPWRDHLGALLYAIARDLDAESRTSPAGSARSAQRDAWENVKALAEKHGADRAHGGMTLKQMVTEFPALRSAVTQLWFRSLPAATSDDLVDLIRFDEAVDLSLTQSVSEFMDRLNRSRETFLGILGHDLRNPLSTIISAGRLIAEDGLDAATTRDMASRIVSTGERMHQLVVDLLDFTRTRFSGHMPIQRRECDLAQTVKRVAGEFTTSHPRRAVHVRVSGDLRGHWDDMRMSQAVANLLGNAVDHGADGTPVEISTSANESEVAIAVHNDGPPIEKERHEQLFEPFSTMRAGDTKHHDPRHLGLGLYITKAIVAGHNGHIDVDSSAQHGTTFTVHLPRRTE
jgi:signal transduction histidine kinase